MNVQWCDMVLERTWTWTPFVFRLGSPVECLGRRPDILERNAIVEPCVDNLEVKLVRHDTQSWGYAREYLSTSRSKVTQTPDDPASNNLLEILVREHEKMKYFIIITNSWSDRGRNICDNRHNRIKVEEHEGLQRRVSSSEAILHKWTHTVAMRFTRNLRKR